MCIKDQAVEHFNRYVDRWMEDAVWSGGCRSWYKNHSVDGRVSALWGGSGLHFIEALEDPRWEDYEYEYLDPICQYAYFGNGFVEVEQNGGNRNVHNVSRNSRSNSCVTDIKRIGQLKRVGIMKDHPYLTSEQKQEKERHEAAAKAALTPSAL